MAQGILYYQSHEGAFILKTPQGQKTIPMDKAEISRGSFATALEEAANHYTKPAETTTVDLIMPHTLYGVDYVTLPNIKRSQVEEAFKAELRSSYKNYSDLAFQKTDIRTGKTITFRVLFMRKSLMKDLKEGFAKLGIQIERFIPQGVALQEGAAKQESAVKKNPCVILNIGDEDSYLAAYAGDVLLGGIPVPFGVRALSDSRLVYEKQLFHRDSAELLVINAKERAKSTKLTMAIDLGEEIDDSVPDEDEVIPENPALPDLTVAGTDEAHLPQPEEEEEDLPPAVKTLRRSAIRVLPKFMRREVPTTPEGFLLENFRMFEKRVLMLIRDMSMEDYYPKIENIYVALPREFALIVEAMKSENPDFKWTMLNEYDEDLLLSGAARISGGKAAVF